MAAHQRKKKKKPSIRLELTWGGLAGLGVVSFCIFLWMFLLGIWAGQTVLHTSDMTNNASLTESLSGIWQPRSNGSPDNAQQQFGFAENGNDVRESQKEEWLAAEQSYFSLQVASFRDRDIAQEFVLNWRTEGHDTFLLPPENGKNDSKWRVVVGKFEKLADANALAARFEEEDNIRAYIALLPSSKFSKP